MIDLHSHILPSIDDGARDLSEALAMARAYVDQDVDTVVCTPHILPGIYCNSGPQIRKAVENLQRHLDDAAIPVRLLPGADNHITPDFVAGLQRGHLLSIADTRYVLVEPPHHVVPARVEQLFFDILVANHVPVLTHPERLTWIDTKYDMIKRLAARGVWMQITSGSLRGKFGRRARYWAERMLSEGIVHLIASDAHDAVRRSPDLADGRLAAAKIVGEEEAEALALTRPQNLLLNKPPKDCVSINLITVAHRQWGYSKYVKGDSACNRGSFSERMRGFFS
jgi:protein-tyrosine phosphatase